MTLLAGLLLGLIVGVGIGLLVACKVFARMLVEANMTVVPGRIAYKVIQCPPPL